MGTYEKKREKNFQKNSHPGIEPGSSPRKTLKYTTTLSRHTSTGIGIIYNYVQSLKSTVFFKEFLQFFVFLGISYIRPLKEPTSTSVTTCKKGSSWIQT